MITHLFNSLNMHGYGWYIWTAYATVAVLLGAQWYLPFRRSLRYNRSQEGIQK